MAYLGNAPARSFISFERQVFTIVNSQTAYTLDHSVNNENDIRLVVNNIVQEPGSGKAYTASGTTLTLSAALTNGTDEMYCVFLGRAVATNKPGAGSVGTTELAADAVTEAKIADDAVESEHLNDNVISGHTELASAPASTDELLISDAGTLKRIDVSLVGGANTPAFEATKNALQYGVTLNSDVKITYETEIFDTAGNYASSRFTPTTAGKYFVYCNQRIITQNNNTLSRTQLKIFKNGSQYQNAMSDFNLAENYIRATGNHISATVDMNGSSDYVEIYGYISNYDSATTNTGFHQTGGSVFGAFKIIE